MLRFAQSTAVVVCTNISFILERRLYTEQIADVEESTSKLDVFATGVKLANRCIQQKTLNA